MTITFHCECGKQLRAKEEHAGKRAKCPSCGKPVAVPSKQSPASADSEQSARPTSRDETRTSSSSTKAAPRKPRRPAKRKATPPARSRLPIWVIGAVAVLLLAGAAFFYWGGGGEGEPIDRAPAKVAETTAGESAETDAPAASPFAPADGSPIAAKDDKSATGPEPAKDAVESTEKVVEPATASKVATGTPASASQRRPPASPAGNRAAGGHWVQFRGPDGSGTSAQSGLPATWSATENIVWQKALPGFGSSSPIVVGDRIIVTCYSGYGTDAKNPGDQSKLRLHTVCVARASGEILWDAEIDAKLPEQKYQSWMTKHGYASSTAVSDGRAVYVFFGHTGVFAFDLSGERLWSADVGSKTHGFGTGASPILYENLVIVNASVESQSLIALDRKSGQQVWSARGIRESWNTPVLVEASGGKHELVLMTADKLLAFDPADGKPLWNCAGSQPPRYICPSVIVHEGVVYALHGYHGPLAAVRPGGRGDVTGSHQLWTIPKKGSNVPSPVFHEGHIYWVKENGGIAFCADAKSGEVVYQKRLNPSPGLIYASPLAADGRIYYVSRENGTYVLEAKPAFELIAHNAIASDDSVFNGSPVVVDGRLLLRSDKALYCIGTK